MKMISVIVNILLKLKLVLFRISNQCIYVCMYVYNILSSTFESKFFLLVLIMMLVKWCNVMMLTKILKMACKI